MRSGEPVTSASACTTMSKGTPHHSAAAAAASAFGTCCTPCRASRTSPVPHGVARRNSGGGRRRAPRPRPAPRRRRRPRSRAPDRGSTDAMRGHPGVVEVQDGDAGGGQRRHELALGPRHAVEVAEELHVCHGDAGHDADVGPRHPGEALDVARAAGAHLEHDPASVVGCVQERQREAELVVEGALARRERERRAETAVERSLVVVLPTEPVIPTTPPTRVRASTPRSIKRGGGVGNDHGRPPGGLAHRRGRRPPRPRGRRR